MNRPNPAIQEEHFIENDESVVDNTESQEVD